MGGGEEPVRARKKAGGDGAVVDVVAARAVFDDDLPGKEKGVGGDEAGLAGGYGDGRGPVQADGAGDVIEATGARLEVVGAVRSREVLIIFAAGKTEVAIGGEVVGVLVVGDGIGAKKMVGVGDL